MQRQLRRGAVAFQLGPNQIRFRRDTFLDARSVVGDYGVEPRGQVPRDLDADLRKRRSEERPRRVERELLACPACIRLGRAHLRVSAARPRESLNKALEWQRGGRHRLACHSGDPAPARERGVLDVVAQHRVPERAGSCSSAVRGTDPGVRCFDERVARERAVEHVVQREGLDAHGRVTGLCSCRGRCGCDSRYRGEERRTRNGGALAPMA